MLNETIKKELLAYAEKIDIDVSQLDSYSYVRNIYGGEPHLAVNEYDWDENEEWKARLLKLADYVEADGLSEYATLADDEDMDREITSEAVNWLRTMGEN